MAKAVNRRKKDQGATFGPDVAAEVCLRISEGESLVAVCRDPSLPGVRTVMRWVAENEAFRQDYMRAREAKADADADAIGDIAARTLTGEYDPSAARVAIDALKWAAGKMQPKKYGDKIDLNHGGGMVVTIAGPDADL